ncbi:DUF4242 domain-containing protein [Danxiaibacter flavus]|uniref:DUF4242 domain-containing protein n=1 Tax=Danxiaibacter flavus TaxID=3049108 RepID=A0ABV3ZMS3_9BACT|nr:DUF4242 domain-containing protein [Chitinophagaceae bacterium DXS]
MKISFSTLMLLICSFVSLHSYAQTNQVAATNTKKMYIDVHQLEPGKVKFEDVAAAHAKDLAVEKKYGVHFINYWVDEQQGLVYCLSTASDTGAVRKTHAEAHGLLPAYTFEVTDGITAALTGNKELFLDIHKLGAGNVTAAAVADAHKKDLAVQDKYGVNFINYWVDEKAGVVMCLSEAKNAESVIATHKEAHGLVPVEVLNVKQGQ